MDAGDAAWVLASAALVLFMTPGLALFYGGMDRSRNVLNMLMMNFWCLLIVPIVWVAVGFSLAYSGDGNVHRQPRLGLPRRTWGSPVRTAARRCWPSASSACSP